MLRVAGLKHLRVVIVLYPGIFCSRLAGLPYPSLKMSHSIMNKARGEPSHEREPLHLLRERPTRMFHEIGYGRIASMKNKPHPRECNANDSTASPSLPPKGTPSPSKRKRDTVSGSSSSLSEASPLASPSTAPPPLDRDSGRASPSSSTFSDDARQPPPAPSAPNYQTFGPNPLAFDDPTVYEILPVTDDMSDEERKKIYGVASFPHDDLHELIAGTPPNKDFSNTVKPNNQVAFHTFHSYTENYLRPLKEEDIGFLNERVYLSRTDEIANLLTVSG